MNKYRAKPTTIDGIRFASMAEASWYIVLKDLETLSMITGLKVQPKYKLLGGIIYIGDFEYMRDGKVVTEDVKGHKTDVYKLKARLFKATFGRQICEIRVKPEIAKATIAAYLGAKGRQRA